MWALSNAVSRVYNLWFLIKYLASGNDRVCLRVGFEFLLRSKFGAAKSDWLHLLWPGSQNNYHIRINNILEMCFVSTNDERASPSIA